MNRKTSIGLGIGASAIAVGFAGWSIYERFFKHEDGAEPMSAEFDITNGGPTLGYIAGRQIQLDLVSIGDGQFLHRPAAEAFLGMRDAAAADGVILHVNSSFRSMQSQQALYAKYLNGTGNLAAKPGYSNHQSGLSADISTNGLGRESSVYRWLDAHAAQFGFVNDVKSEAWHWTWAQGKKLLGG